MSQELTPQEILSTLAEGLFGNIRRDYERTRYETISLSGLPYILFRRAYDTSIFCLRNGGVERFADIDCSCVCVSINPDAGCYAWVSTRGTVTQIASDSSVERWELHRETRRSFGVGLLAGRTPCFWQTPYPSCQAQVSRLLKSDRGNYAENQTVNYSIHNKEISVVHGEKTGVHVNSAGPFPGPVLTGALFADGSIKTWPKENWVMAAPGVSVPQASFFGGINGYFYTIEISDINLRLLGKVQIEGGQVANGFAVVERDIAVAYIRAGRLGWGGCICVFLREKDNEFTLPAWSIAKETNPQAEILLHIEPPYVYVAETRENHPYRIDVIHVNKGYLHSLLWPPVRGCCFPKKSVVEELRLSSELSEGARKNRKIVVDKGAPILALLAHPDKDWATNVLDVTYGEGTFPHTVQFRWYRSLAESDNLARH